mmetsp:Transcript_63977/g.202427  ORF Transcript_63977/g.202427 Transcript_63977/m.202427 type:complete len:266 (+) Transcript_63977:348-1145(+)
MNLAKPKSPFLFWKPRRSKMHKTVWLLKGTGLPLSSTSHSLLSSASNWPTALSMVKVASSHAFLRLTSSPDRCLEVDTMITGLETTGAPKAPLVSSEPVAKLVPLPSQGDRGTRQQSLRWVASWGAGSGPGATGDPPPASLPPCQHGRDSQGGLGAVGGGPAPAKFVPGVMQVRLPRSKLLGDDLFSQLVRPEILPPLEHFPNLGICRIDIVPAIPQEPLDVPLRRFCVAEPLLELGHPLQKMQRQDHRTGSSRGQGGNSGAGRT